MPDQNRYSCGISLFRGVPFPTSLCQILLSFACLSFSVFGADPGKPKIHKMYGPDFLLSDKEAQELYEKAQDLYFNGDLSGALETSSKALTQTERIRGKENSDVPILLTWQAGVFQAGGNLSQASELLEHSLKIGERVWGAKHPVVAVTLGQMALCELDQGKLAQGESRLSRCLPILETAYGKEHPAVAEALQTRALVFAIQGKYGEASALLERCSAIIRRECGEDSYLYGSILIRSAMLDVP